MVPRGLGAPGEGERRFFLARTPDEGPPELSPSEARHARTVLRLAPGDRLTGLDGKGAAFPLRVAGIRGGGLELAADGPARREPVPGEAGATLPWIEVATAWPKGAAAEEMVDRLAQLGASAIQPVVFERSPPQSRDLAPARLERLERIAREACKQCGRLWLPVLRPPRPASGISCDATVLLLQGAEAGLSEVARRLGGAPRIRVVVGPEGGPSPAEERDLLGRGAAAARLSPHVLRIETAAEAALAVLVEACFSRPRS